jgi:predicted phage terminase large subunit-like protein
VDFAISQKEKADYTVFAMGGMEFDGQLDVVDVARGRWDARGIVERWFELDARWKPEWWIAEEGIIRKVIGPFLNAEMRRRNHYLNIILKTPVKDKISRAASFQARCRAQGVRFDKDAPWYLPLEMEMLSFPRAIHDDQVDALGWLGIGLDEMTEHPSVEEVDEEEYHEARRSAEVEMGGRSAVTGY